MKGVQINFKLILMIITLSLGSAQSDDQNIDQNYDLLMTNGQGQGQRQSQEVSLSNQHLIETRSSKHYCGPNLVKALKNICIMYRKRSQLNHLDGEHNYDSN